MGVNGSAGSGSSDRAPRLGPVGQSEPEVLGLVLDLTDAPAVGDQVVGKVGGAAAGRKATALDLAAQPVGPEIGAMDGLKAVVMAVQKLPDPLVGRRPGPGGSSGAGGSLWAGGEGRTGRSGGATACAGNGRVDSGGGSRSSRPLRGLGWGVSRRPLTASRSEAPPGGSDCSKSSGWVGVTDVTIPVFVMSCDRWPLARVLPAGVQG